VDFVSQCKIALLILFFLRLSFRFRMFTVCDESFFNQERLRINIFLPAKIPLALFIKILSLFIKMHFFIFPNPHLLFNLQ